MIPMAWRDRPGSAPRGFAAALLVVAAALAPVPAGAAPARSDQQPGPARQGPGQVAAAGLSTARAPGDPTPESQWQLDMLRAEEAWELSTGTGQIVAVIDSGVDARHPDLTGRVLPGRDLVDGSTDGRVDPVGHGTTVAALIAGRARGGTGVAGLAPGARILPVRVLDEQNRYQDARVVAEAVRWAVDAGASVVTLSLGGAGASPSLGAALDYAFAQDVVVIACTGNDLSDRDEQVWYPAREPGVLAVTGLARSPGDGTDATLWPGAVTGPETVLAAPAADLVGARPGGYWRVQGTSFAAPLVAATAAMIRSEWPRMSAGDVVNRLVSTAQDLGEPGRDEVYGFGGLDPVAALTATVPAVQRNPLDTNRRHGVAGFGRAPGKAAGAGGAVPDPAYRHRIR